MNSLERIGAAISFQETDRTPVIPQIFGHSALLSGKTLAEYGQNALVAAKCQIEALRRYKHDSVFAVMDVCIEAEAIGAELRHRPGLYPAVATPPLAPHSDFLKLEIPDPVRAGRMPEILAMAGKLREKVGADTLVVGMVLGPMTQALQFLGPEAALYLAADDSDRFEQLLDYCADLAIRFGVAQIKAGAHLPMVFEPAGSPEVVPTAFFRELLIPRLTKIFAAFKHSKAWANWLHIAGQTLPILPFYSDMGVDIGNFDYCVDAARLRHMLPEKLCVDGNLKPVAFIESAPEEIEAEGRRLIHTFGQRRGFILSSGCEIPPESKPENIEALVRATRTEACCHISSIVS